MPQSSRKPKTSRIRHPFQGRATGMMVLFGGCYLALAGRLVYLQGIKGKEIREIAIQKRNREFKVTAHRGTILDRNGVVLATNRYLGDVVFDYKAFPVKGADSLQYDVEKKRFEKSLQYLSEKLNISVSELQKQVNESVANKRRAEIIKKDLSWDDAQKVRYPVTVRPNPRKPSENEEIPFKLLGFFVQDRTQRTYPVREDALHVVGMMGEHQSIAHKEFGVMGLEQGLEELLKGKNGKSKAEVDLFMREIPGTKTNSEPVADGLTIHTTLDTSVQHVAMKAAQNIVDKFQPLGVSIVIIEPYTGDILAMVSAPSFDPNPEARAKLQYDKDIKPGIRERCATYRIEPGSTFKTLTIASALQHKVIDTNTWFDCSGFLPLGKHGIKCDSHGGNPAHGHQQSIDILRHSCNVGAAQIGLRMGGTLLRTSMEEFGICENLGLPVTDPQPKFMKSEQGRFTTKKGALSIPDTARVAFGHAIMATPIHIANAYAAVANGGMLMKPRLIAQLTDSEGHVKVENKPQALRRVLSPEVANQVNEMLRAVVSTGTGRGTALAGYQLAGKTGTARKYKSEHGLPYVSSFCGFVPDAPNTRPRAVVLVLVDEPTKSYYGADVALPAFHQIAQDLLRDIWHVPEDDPQSTQLQMAQLSLKKAAQPHKSAKKHKKSEEQQIAERD